MFLNIIYSGLLILIYSYYTLHIMALGCIFIPIPYINLLPCVADPINALLPTSGDHRNPEYANVPWTYNKLHEREFRVQM